MSEQRKSIHDGWTPQPHEQPQPDDPLAVAPSTPEPGIDVERLGSLRQSIEVHGDLYDEGGTLVEPSPEYDEWLRRVAVAYGRLVVLALRAVDAAAEYARLAPPAEKEQT